LFVLSGDLRRVFFFELPGALRDRC
jgi:hypothetical protein